MELQKKDIRKLTLPELEEFFLEQGEKKFRAKQVYEWLWNKSLKNFDEMSNISLSTREMLKTHFSINHIRVDLMQHSSDGTIKNAVKLFDDKIVESVLIPTTKRITACISSQVGCSLDCNFCATARLKRMRNLNSDEIYDQVVAIKDEAETYFQRPLTNIVFMGMGEPLLNFIPVIESAKIMKEQLAYGLSRKRITISTSGITPQIDQLHNEVDVSLAISLHAPTNELRDEIVPINKKYPISELMKSCYNYLNFYAGKRSITIEYVLIDGVNDSEELAIKLAKLLSKISCKINLIPFNPFDGSSYKRSSNRNIETFKNVLIKKGFITTLRVTRGDAVDGACGQLVGRLTKSIKGKKLISHQSIS